ncbi:hypothetical protein [Actinosynnema mirum]|uniref:Secreted protein n=1 Tax=Actinosynnema mirum (strain ATCC 29888 / DSM 43827 / JCM 3225 / NBRC 14064 / NCIMB 13271 / NRRL B-12336 / IMRU 3971 / 101) TaxID=446462 RepID=C6WKJ8_ACTMD|nr:hypothetical protein [Actinosynnema mirum]ACU40249.1 hypothetical protein Amir_6448 [Actinosynnema mirum DSM 43827]
MVRRSGRLTALGAVAAAVVSLLLGGTANASGEHAFTAQARAAGLSSAQAEGLQDKVDGYLEQLGDRGKQVAPNQIDLGGAVLNVTVPGEDQPRNLAEVTTNVDNAAQCSGNWARYRWFCAYRNEWFSGDNIGMYSCGEYYIPWYTMGSWHNNQTTGTRPWLYFNDGQDPWHMPPADSQQASGVGWTPVYSIVNC